MRGIVSVALLVACSAPAFSGDFYPLAKGTKWEYQLTVQGMEIEATQEVTKVAEKKGEPAKATVVTLIKGQKNEEELTADAKGVYRHSFNGTPLETPITAIKLPAKSGTKWTQKITVMKDELEINSEVLDEEKIEVEAGKYKTFPVKTVIEVKGQKITTKTWLADGVGIVKQELEIPGGITVKMELKKFTPVKE